MKDKREWERGGRGEQKRCVYVGEGGGGEGGEWKWSDGH